MVSHRLRPWFGDWVVCRAAKLGTQWNDYDDSDSNTVFAHPNAMALARSLYRHWPARYRRQFPDEDTTEEFVPSRLAQKLGLAYPTPPKATPYVEEDDDEMFISLLILYEQGLGSRTLKEIQDTLVEMYEEFTKVDWSD